MIGTPVVINTSSSGNTPVVAAQEGNRIKVLGFFLVVGGATNITFTDGASGDVLCGQMNFAANGGIISQEVQNPDQGEYWMQTSVNTALVITNSNPVQVGGILRYVRVSA